VLKKRGAAVLDGTLWRGGEEDYSRGQAHTTIKGCVSLFLGEKGRGVHRVRLEGKKGGIRVRERKEKTGIRQRGKKKGKSN